MKKQILMGATVVQLISYLFLPVTDAAAARDDWQEQRLLAPSGPQLSTEQRGRVVIYDGLDEALVDRALDTQFARVENMMFIRVRHTDPEGDSWADDDCD